MAQQTINLGSAPNDGTGDTLRQGGDKANDNFSELYKRYNNDTVSSSSGALSIDYSTEGDNLVLTLTENISSFTITNWPPSGTVGRLSLFIINTGAFNITSWPANTIWPGGGPPAISSGDGLKDLVVLITYDGGTTIWGAFVGQDFSVSA